MPMEAQPSEVDLVAEIEARQNAVLEELDRLNERIEAAIAEFAALRVVGLPEDEASENGVPASGACVSTGSPPLADAA